MGSSSITIQEPEPASPHPKPIIQKRMIPSYTDIMGGVERGPLTLAVLITDL